MDEEDEDEVVLIQGRISESCGESNHVMVGDEDFAELGNQFNGKIVTVRYWITDEPKTVEECVEDVLLDVMGYAKAKFIVHWSDITGYLWTDEEFKVGGHDLVECVEGYKGKHLLMEVTVHNNPRELTLEERIVLHCQKLGFARETFVKKPHMSDEYWHDFFDDFEIPRYAKGETLLGLKT